MHRTNAQVIVSLAALAIAGFAASSQAAMPVAPELYLIPGAFPKDQQPDGNSLVVVAPQGLIVVDTGRHAAHTQQIVDFATLMNRPVVAIINTHWHLDHIGGNVMLRDKYPGVSIYASGALRDAQNGFLKDYRQQLLEAISTAKPGQDVSAWRTEIGLIDAGGKLAPTQIIDKTATLDVAGRKLTLHMERNAVTAGDLWIEDAGSRVVAAGDLVTLPVPFLDTACPKQWQASLDHIAAVQFTTLVPGHGKPMSPAEFAAYRSAFAVLLTCADSKQSSAACADQWLADAGTLIEADDRSRVGSMIDYYMQAALRAPAQARPKYCTA